MREKKIYTFSFFKLSHLIYVAMLIFSAWLMWHTFSYNSQSHEIQIASKIWSDFGSALPQLRSFSQGSNWPPEYPLFPGEPTRYHFLFYFLAGNLEKFGLPIDWAMNLPSTMGLFLLMVFIWKVSQVLFHDLWTSLLSVFFFLFNGSFSFLEYFAKHPLSPSSFTQLISNSVFPSFGPWSGSLVSAFWNLNIYTNQRHLALSFAIALLTIYILLLGRRKSLYLLGFSTASLFFLNQAAFVITGLFLLWFFLFRPELRFPLLISAMGALPWFFIWNLVSHSLPPIIFQPGFLTPSPFTIIGFLKYWLYNFGLQLFLIPLGFMFSSKSARILIIPLLILFVIPNLFRLSPDMINNHKFFNLFLIISGMFSANLLIRIFKVSNFGKFIFLILTPFLILGGVVDFFPVKNDTFLSLQDAPTNPDINYFRIFTPPDSVILNSTWFYHPASLAGRSIYNGYSYFTWSYGYNQVQREQTAVEIFRAESKYQACFLLQRENISFVELQDHPEEFIHPNYELWRNQFVLSYVNPHTGLSVYNVAESCQSI